MEEKKKASADWLDAYLDKVKRCIRAIPRTGPGTSGTVACPVCGGKINYSFASCNGHLLAECEQPGCFAIME